MASLKIHHLWMALAIIYGAVFPVRAIPQPGHDGDYFKVDGPCGFQFPDDHGEHSGYRTEWWYYTGNVFDAKGNQFGFQLTFFRSQISTNQEMEITVNASSNWRFAQIYFGHAAISDISRNRFFHDDLMTRGALKLAGVDARKEEIHVYLKNWSATIKTDEHRLKCRSDDFALDIHLKALKPLVAHGNDGYSRKGRSPERASCYYSYTRLKADGFITIDDVSYAISGNAWMDHEYSSAPLDPVAIGWDWFSLQFDDQTELMLFFVREMDGGFSPASGGTFIDARGQKISLALKQVHVQVDKKWKSPSTQAVYPSQWQIEIPDLELRLQIRSNLDDQELTTHQSTGVTYWEGSVRVIAERQQKPLTGHGYVELTGYAEPFRSPL
ncbi:MAG: lipocalin-like domain-containing protein [Thermodesulfobacteriota bacterium]